MKPDNPWLHRYAIFVALCALIAIAAGAIVTSLERPIAVQLSHLHESGLRILASHCRRCSSGLDARARDCGPVAIRLDRPGCRNRRRRPRIHRASLRSGILHALIAQVFFGCIVAAIITMSASWKRGPVPIEDSWRPSLRSLAIAVPAVILLQTTLGASYRYRALGVLWHILNAMIVLLLILCVAVFLIRQFPEHPTLKPTAVALAVITSIQVMLGFTTFMMLILFPETSLAVVITSVLHVTTGALTFGAALTLSILIRYNIRVPGAAALV